jgi:7-carboxy-7-deazaguanine synthase
MRIAEIFYSVQGEGILAGVPSAFIRTSGCNLRCWFCDTPYTSWQPEGDELSIAAILERLGTFPTQHVVVTGGEPLLAPQVEELCAGLHELRRHVTVETAATIFRPIACDLVSLSPKLSNSTPWRVDGGRHAAHHEQLRLQIDVIQTFMDRYPYQLKFVIDQPADVGEVVVLLEQLRHVDRSLVLLMPQGISAEELAVRGRWLVEECKKHGFRFCPRLHIDLYGNRRGT